MSWLIDPTQRVLAGALDGLSLREQAIASNMANVDTPGYRAAAVDFESELQAALAGAETGSLAMNQPTAGPSATAGMARSDGAHFAGVVAGPAGLGGGIVQTQPAGIQKRVDGNGVDVESDMTALAETQLKYGAVARLLTGKIGMLRDVVQAR